MAELNQPGDPLEISATEWNQVRAATLGRDGIRDGGGRFIPEVLIAKTGIGGIPARIGTTAGVSEVTIVSLNSEGELDETDRTENCRNITQAAVGGDTYIVIARVFGTREFVVIVEDCGVAS